MTSLRRALAPCLIVLFFVPGCNDRQPLKIFDVHLHGSSNPGEQMRELGRNGVYKIAVSTSWPLQEQYVQTDSINVLQGLMLPCPDGRVPYSRQLCFENGGDWPPLEWVDSLLRNKKIHFVGEVLTQYYGISSSDTLMYPYYRLAEKYNIPVGVHTGGAGPDHGCPNFDMAMGNPKLLKETLKTFPSLRLWIMHGGVPFVEETIQTMKEFPGLYADMSAINNPDIMKPEEFSNVIKLFVDEGFEDRIMFGSDNGDITTTVASIRNLSFLSEGQKRKIFFENAEAFFGR